MEDLRADSTDSVSHLMTLYGEADKTPVVLTSAQKTIDLSGS
jgi:hypothetical protein